MTEKKDKVVDDKGEKAKIVVLGRLAHKTIQRLLKVDPCSHLMTCAAIFGGTKTIVPLKEIPGLIDAFKDAIKIVTRYANRAITNLEWQQDEAIKRIEEKKED